MSNFNNLNMLCGNLTSSLKGQVTEYQIFFREALRQEGLKSDFLDVVADTERPKYNPGTVHVLRLQFRFLVRTTLSATEVVARLAKMGLDAQCLDCYILKDANGWLLVHTIPVDLNF